MRGIGEASRLLERAAVEAERPWAALAVFVVSVGGLTAAVLVVYPGYGILFHEIASDAVFAVAFAGWSSLGSRAAPQPSVSLVPAVIFWLVLGLVGVVLRRPANALAIATPAVAAMR